MTHQISAEHLTVQKIAEIIEGHHTLKLSADAIKRITHCREYLDKKIPTAVNTSTRRLPRATSPSMV